ncbi:hypothetical protein GCM10018962_53490 [Dactylosporangium matsuzakiense]|nr:S8 family serine peptidase [Dactylosporangium matsuzakiense]
MSGTSMATPHVTGAATVLKQQHPQWTPQRLKAVLMASAKHNAGPDPNAQGAGGEVRVSFSVEREVESYDLTLVHTGRDGAAATLFNTLVQGLDADWLEGVSTDSTTTLRLPKGRYTIDSAIIEDGAATQLVQPVVDLTAGPSTVRLDARLGRPVRITVPDRTAIPVSAELSTREHVFGGTTNLGGFFTASFDGLFSARIGPDSSGPGPVTTVVGGRWARPGPGGSIVDSAETYVLYWFHEGHMDSGFQRTVTKSDLAAVTLDVGSTAAGVESWTDAAASTASGDENLIGYGVPLHAPFTRATATDATGGAVEQTVIRAYRIA